MSHVQLAAFDNSWYSSGRPRHVQAAWFLFGLPLLRSRLLPGSSFRRWLLTAFGAQLGTNVVIKPGVRVKNPWLLWVGNDSWIGEDAWIDNIAPVHIGNDVCISQGAYLCTGNHNWSDPAFGLFIKPIRLDDGAWVGARAMVCPGVEIAYCGIAAAGSLITNNIPEYEVHAGNPARLVTMRRIESRAESAFRSPSTATMSSKGNAGAA
jgi:putative colanic acid biosynthesis acetyltransferase WcaF